MKNRCTPRKIQKIYQQHRSWRAAARELNSMYGVNLPHVTWRNYATGYRDIANPKIRAALMLGPRACPTCGHHLGATLSHLLRRLRPRDLKHWLELRRQGKYKNAMRYIKKVYHSPIKHK